MESTAFQHEYHKLHVGIRNGVEQLAIEAYSKDLVCESVKNKATLTTTDQDMRAKAFLDAVKDRIRADPGTFYKFVDLLREQAVYAPLAESLEKRIPVTESRSQREDPAPCRDTPTHDGHLQIIGRKGSILGDPTVLPFLSPLQRRDKDSGTPPPRPLPNQKAELHPLVRVPSSVYSPQSSMSSVSTDSEDSPNEFSPVSEVAVRTTAPTPVTEQSGGSPGGKPPVQQEQGSTKDGSQSHNKLAVVIPQRSFSTDSDFVTPPSTPQPSPIQETLTEGTSTTALAGADYSPRPYHHTRKISELKEKLSEMTTLLQQKDKALLAAKSRLLQRDKKSKENKKSLREMQSRLEKTERRCGALQADLDSSYLTNEALQMKITELKRQLEILGAKACAYDEICKARILEGRLEELQMKLNRMVVHCDCMHSH